MARPNGTYPPPGVPDAEVPDGHDHDGHSHGHKEQKT